MPLKTKKEIADIVLIDSSDDDDEGGANTASLGKAAPLIGNQSEKRKIPSEMIPPAAPLETLEYRSFWKAGDYAMGPISIAPTAPGSLEHARVHPKFLHSNATSHKWAFGALAELLDNAVDEIQNGATFVKVDKIDIVKDNSPALLFQDDGGGMDPEALRKCMSLGYSSKKSNTTIGQYGNGFKTSTMRLGADVIVFSRATRGSKVTQSVGLLSYTFLRKTGQDDVIVPMIDFDISDHWAEPIIYGSQEDWSVNLKTILEWSPFASKEELLQQFEDIGSHGTKIIIYNLWLNDEGIYELSFDDDDEDIRLRDEANHGVTKLNKKIAELRSHISFRLRYSLRAYASMLYLRKLINFKIILRGKPVEQFDIADELKYPKVVTYKPQVATTKQGAVDVRIGFIKEAPSLPVCGFNVYHKNRLIRPFWKVTPDGSSRGHCVVGVLEANFIEPAHDKQDFERSLLFVRLESRLKLILMDYWYNHCHLYGYTSHLVRSDNTQKKTPVQSPVVSTKKFSASEERGTSCSNIQEICLDEAIVSLPATSSPNLRNWQNGSDFPTAQASPELIPALSVEQVILEDDHPVQISADQTCEENLQLFMRCEEYVRKEAELEQTIEELEKELGEAKSKCTQLSALVEAKRKEKTVKQQASKVS